MDNILSKYHLYNNISNFINDNDLHIPRNIFRLCENNNWRLIPYCDNETLLSVSKDGFSYYKNNQFYIFYNNNAYDKRINFTIAHEIGHIILNHHIYLPSDVLMFGDKGIWEDHANIFSRNILMPAELLNNLSYKNINSLMNFFGTSRSMVKNRLNSLEEDLIWLNKIK